MVVEDAAIEELLEVRGCISGRELLRVDRVGVRVCGQTGADKGRFDLLLWCLFVDRCQRVPLMRNLPSS